MLITNNNKPVDLKMSKMGAKWKNNIGEDGKWVVDYPSKYVKFSKYIDYPNESDFCNALSILVAEFSKHICDNTSDLNYIDDFNKIYSKFTLMKMFYHCLFIEKEFIEKETKGIYEYSNIAKKAICIMLQNNVDLDGNEFDYMKFDTSHEFLMYAALLSTKPKTIDHNIKIKTQYKIECIENNYVADLVILKSEERKKDFVYLGIECNGGYHNSSEEQIAYDYIRENKIGAEHKIMLRKFSNDQIEEDCIKWAKTIWNEIGQE